MGIPTIHIRGIFMVRIESVERFSPAEKAKIKAGDEIISINGNEIRDVLDYRYYICEKKTFHYRKKKWGRKNF